MKKNHQIILHVAFWLIFNVLQYARYIALNYGDISSTFYIIICVQILLNLVTFYGIYFVFFNKILDFHKASSFASLGLYILMNIVVRVYISRYVFAIVEKETWLDKYNSFWLQTLFVFTYAGLAFLVRFTVHWFYDQQIKKELINQKQASELALLRAQVNPHFLFNTLNNIYSLALQKSENVALSIARLSDIMRYMLSNSNVEKVPLKKELDYLESFIELQRLRNEYENFVEYSISGDIMDKEITPMLLIPFIENAFKHGNKNVEAPGIIIKFELEKQILKLTVINYIKEHVPEETSTGLSTGLDNVKQRLEFVYKGRYQLDIKKDTYKSRFEVNLTIEL